MHLFMYKVAKKGDIFRRKRIRNFIRKIASKLVLKNDQTSDFIFYNVKILSTESAITTLTDHILIDSTFSSL